MEIGNNKADCVQQLNTKGCCFLCLEAEDAEKAKNNTEADYRKMLSIRSLLRHLQITSFDKQIFTEKEIKVDLCESCQKTFIGFTIVLEELEKAQMKMNYFLERISKAVSDSKKDSKRVQVYSKRMTDDPKALTQLAFVDKLRKNLATKSLEMQVGPIPRISLEKIVVKRKLQIKKEVVCSEELNEVAEVEDMFENDDPEPALSSLKPPLQPIKREKEMNRLTKDTKPDKRLKSQNVCYKKITETGMYQCIKCDKTCGSRRGIVDHYKSVHRKIRYKCDICNFASYTTNCQLKLHRKTCRETLEERLAKAKERKGFKFVCDLCRKRFRYKLGLQNHQSVHKNINRYACNLCDKKYTKLCSLNTHKDAVHLGKVFYCRFCKKGIRRKFNFHRHEELCKYGQKNTTGTE